MSDLEASGAPPGDDVLGRLRVGSAVLHARSEFDAIALRDAPDSFRRRNVFVHPSSLDRV